MNKITIIAAGLPPKLDGIGDYTANLAAELTKQCDVTVLTAYAEELWPIPGVVIKPVFTKANRASVKNIAVEIKSDPPDWVILQYNPFAYGKWGLNLFLPAAVAQIKRDCPQTRFALMVHEPFVPVLDIKHAIMTIWQRWQLWSLGRSADVVFFSIDPWVKKFRRWFPSKEVVHLPVGSNMPHIQTTRAAERVRLGIADHVVVLGYFGTFHNFRMPNWVGDAAECLKRSGYNPLVLYVGPHSENVCRAIGRANVRAEGLLSPENVSRCLTAVDIYLAPFMDGISSRRTTFLSALQHGLPTVGTENYNTDRMLSDQNGTSFLLAGAHSKEEFNQYVISLARDKELRSTISLGAERFFEANFSWPRIARRLLGALDSVAKPSSAN
jgi:glycosyltransferase involved in cell wall biosynthesis